MLDPARVNLGRLEYSDLSPLTRKDAGNIVRGEPRGFQAVVAAIEKAKAPNFNLLCEHVSR